jgi:hypothetical protein
VFDWGKPRRAEFDNPPRAQILEADSLVGNPLATRSTAPVFLFFTTPHCKNMKRPGEYQGRTKVTMQKVAMDPKTRQAKWHARHCDLGGGTANGHGWISHALKCGVATESDGCTLSPFPPLRWRYKALENPVWKVPSPASAATIKTSSTSVFFVPQIQYSRVSVMTVPAGRLGLLGRILKSGPKTTWPPWTNQCQRT